MGFSKVMGKLMPWISTAVDIAAPEAAPIVAIAAKALSSGLGKTIAADPQAIKDAITEAAANPDQLATLKKIDDDFAIQMQALGFSGVGNLLQIDAMDRASARAMQVQTHSWLVPALAITFVVGFLLIVGLKLFHVVASDPTTDDLIQALRDGVILILSYYFGSSAGSAAKNQIIAGQMNGK